MKLSEFLKVYQNYSEKASNISRQLSFAGIAIIWIFKSGDGIQAKIPEVLIFPLLCFCLALASDLLQYISGTLIWGIFHRREEIKATTDDPEIKAPTYLKKPIEIFFGIKILFVGIAYYKMISFFWDLIFPVITAK